MEKYYKVICNGKELEFKEGTTFKEISTYFEEDYQYPILGVKANEDFLDLGSTIVKDSELCFFTKADEYGNKIYSKSARFILILAVKRVYGARAKVIVVHSQDKGVYFKIEGIKDLKGADKLINKEFQNIVDSDLLFTRLTVSRLEAINFFTKKKMYDKANILKYISNTYINLYRIDNIYDYFYGKMAYSTSQIDMFEVKKLDNGFVLKLPTIYNPDSLGDEVKYSKLQDIFFQAVAFSNNINIKNASELNTRVSKGNVEDIILMSEAFYDRQLMDLADEIITKRSRVILLAGPSSSGKTTSAKKLSIFLKTKGYNTISISLDDYFTDLSKRHRLPDGSYDFESIKAVNTTLFETQIKSLLEGEEVNLPYYDFEKGVSAFRKSTTKINKSDIIVVEGIHALNDILLNNIEDKYKFKIYISPLSSICIDFHNPIHAADIRKLRRIVRDSRSRGLGAIETLSMWADIQKGEIENIYPYQNNVDAAINSCLSYELGVLKTYAEPLLYSVKEDDPEYPEALRLINFLNNFLPIPSDDIPNDSVIREFIGGSCFK